MFSREKDRRGQRPLELSLLPTVNQDPKQVERSGGHEACQLTVRAGCLSSATDRTHARPTRGPRNHSALDLKDAFHQIPLAEGSRYITYTATPRGIFQWSVVVMGRKNGVQYCQRNVEVALEEVRHLAQGYMDDIFIGTNRTQLGDSVDELVRQHFQDIRKV